MAARTQKAAPEPEPEAVPYVDVPEEAAEEAPQPAQHFVLVITDEQGYPQQITPQGLPTTSLPAVLRLAAKMTEKHLEM